LPDFIFSHFQGRALIHKWHNIRMHYMVLNVAMLFWNLNTSKTCHQCHHIGNRKGKEFSCSSCSWSGDADFNGAKNIADLGAVVNQPGGPGLFCLTMAEKIPGLQKAHDFSRG
jgi:hypothetical protein